MAIAASTVWEVRATGNQLNGGGFANLDPGVSVDYSQQDAAQLSLTDIATDGAGTGLSSATGGFTAAMVGNVIYLTGGGVTAGWYQITAYTSTNAVTIDRSALLNKTGVTGNVGGAFKIGGANDRSFFTTTSKTPGNIVHVKFGTYNLGENILTFIVADIQLVGYLASRNDTPTVDDRPTINCGAYNITPGSGGWTTKNLIVTGTAAEVWNQSALSRSFHYNCKFYNTSATAGRKAYYGYQGYPQFYLCEFISTNGIAVDFQSIGPTVQNCYIHDSRIGINAPSAVINLVGSIIANISGGTTPRGLYVTSQGGVVVRGNAFYNCVKGIYGTQESHSIVNNIFHSCGVAIEYDAVRRNHFVDHNCYYNNGTDVINITKGPNDINADPLLVNAADGDFRLLTGSPCINTGMQLGEMVGL